MLFGGIRLAKKGSNWFGLRKIIGLEKRTVNPFTLWDFVISTAMTRKENRSELAPSRKYPFYVDTNAVYSGLDNVSYVYVIDQYPEELELSFRKTLRRECKPNVRISFVTNLNRDIIDWTSSKNKNRLKTWAHLDKTDNAGDVSIYEMAGEVGALDAQDYKKQSLAYLINANIRRKRKLFNVQGIMVISGKRGQAFDDTVKSVEYVCKQTKIKLKRVTGNITDYLESYSPFSMKVDNSLLNQSGSNVITDEIAARLNSYDQGTVGRGSMYWGTDIYSRKSTLKEPKENDTDAENWLIAAETGGGKSYMVKGINLQLLGRDDVVGTINDIEGREYEEMGYIVAVNDKVVMLDIGESGGSYFDPVEIHQTGVEELDKDMFSLANSFTIGIFKALLGAELLKKRDWATPIIKNGINDFYDAIGLDEFNHETWKSTRGKSLFDVFKYVKEYKPENVSDEFLSDREIVISTLEGYLGEDRKGKGRFRKKVSLDSIKDAKLVINSFGMEGRSAQTVDEVNMALMQLYTALISHLRSIFAKANGKYNFKVWEEFQRWGGFPGSEETLKTPLSGGRKLGDINIIITNRPSELLENDRFSIFDSITSFAIGAVGDSEVRRKLCDRFRMPLMLKELDLIESHRKKNRKDGTEEESYDQIKMNPYAKSFLVGIERQEFSIAKMELPPELAMTKLFKTGVKRDVS